MNVKQFLIKLNKRVKDFLWLNTSKPSSGLDMCAAIKFLSNSFIIDIIDKDDFIATEIIEDKENIIMTGNVNGKKHLIIICKENKDI